MSNRKQWPKVRGFWFRLWAHASLGDTPIDKFDMGLVWIKGKLEIWDYPDGSKHPHYYATDRSLNRQLGLRGVAWEMISSLDDRNCTLFGESVRDGRTVAELVREEPKP
jgi:hypothetical protein